MLIEYIRHRRIKILRFTYKLHEIYEITKRILTMPLHVDRAALDV